MKSSSEILADSQEAKRLFENGFSLENILLTYQMKGYDQIDSIKLLKITFNYAQSDAHKIVHYSQAFFESRLANEDLQNTVLKALEELSNE